MKPPSSVPQRFIAICAGIVVVGAISVGLAIRQKSQQSIEQQPVSASTQQQALIQPAAPPGGYVGGDACRRCHQAIWEQYQSHPMSQSSAAVNEAAAIEDFDQQRSFDVSTPVGMVNYRVESTAAGQFHHESMTDPVLGPIYDQQVKIEFVIGTGREGRSYLHVKNDCLFVSPIAWYPQAGTWGLSLGYRPGQHPRFERKATHLCLVCHTDRVAVNAERPDHFNLTSIQGAGISCERCHGPGRDHIAFRERSPDRPSIIAETSDPIVNPSKLDSERRESVCWQCHFSADDRVLRYGRTNADFRPGMSFDEIWVAFVRNDTREPIPIEPVNHVQQIQVSKCSQQSAGRFGCSSCHDAHSVPLPENKDDFYRAKCLACHNDRGCSIPIDERTRTSESDSCVACHMPPRRMEKLSHTSQTDHRILRKPLPKDATIRQSRLAIFNPSGRELTQIEQDLAWGLYFSKEADFHHDAKQAQLAIPKLTAVLAGLPDDVEIQERLGACEALVGQAGRARDRWRKILDRSPEAERVLLRVAISSMDQHDLKSARQYLARYLKINPWDSEAQARMAVLQFYDGQVEAAIRSAQLSLEVNPSDEWPHSILAEAYERLGRHDEAKYQRNLARRLTPPK